MCYPIVCGDFNFHLQNDNDVNTLRFKQLCLPHSFYQLINMSTHIAGNTLDAVLTKDYDNNFIANTVVAKSLATLENLLEKSKKLIRFGLMEYN